MFIAVSKNSDTWFTSAILYNCMFEEQKYYLNITDSIHSMNVTIFEKRCKNVFGELNDYDSIKTVV
jgi:hypothetical protein